MDWRHPNVGCLFHIEQARPHVECNYIKYARSVNVPFVYKLSARDSHSGYKPRKWPAGTEYQFAYGSTFKPQLSDVNFGGSDFDDLSRQVTAKRSGEKWSRDTQNSQYSQRVQSERLSTSWSSGCAASSSRKRSAEHLSDKHYRSARYKVDSPLGMIVPEELSRRRETFNGPISLSCQSDLQNVYTMNYRYKEWVERPTIEIRQEVDNNLLFCRLPETPSQFYDFYNVVRMRRPAKKSNAESTFLPCHTMPIPLSRNLFDASSFKPHLGKFNNFFTSEANISSGIILSQLLDPCRAC